MATFTISNGNNHLQNAYYLYYVRLLLQGTSVTSSYAMGPYLNGNHNRIRLGYGKAIQSPVSPPPTSSNWSCVAEYWQRRAFFSMFTVTGIPKGTTVSSATVRYYFGNVQDDGTMSLRFIDTTDLTPSTGWSNGEIYHGSRTAIGTKTTALTTGEQGSYKNIDVTDLVQALVNKYDYSSSGIMINVPYSATFQKIVDYGPGSGQINPPIVVEAQHVGNDNPPELVITYLASKTTYTFP